MSKTIVINQPYIETPSPSVVMLCSTVEFEGASHILWYETDVQWSEYLCTERADAFLVNLLLFAMERGANIVCKCDISERLYYQLTEYLIPCIASHISRYQSIAIEGNLSSEKLPSANAFGTGVSGGVDSLYTVLKHLKRNDGHSLTHLLFCNAGTNGDFGGEDARETYRLRYAFLKGFADECNLSVVPVDTNINEFLNQVQEATHTFRTLSTSLIFQKLFSVYWYGSGYPFDKFRFSAGDTAGYDLLTMQCISTENLTFYSSGGETTRLGKLKFISDNELAQKYLNVCIAGGIPNCGHCEKCRRTIMGLYAIGKLDSFSQCFNLKDIKDHIFQHKMFAYFHRNRLDWPEIYQSLREQGEINTFNIVTYYCCLLIAVPKIIVYKLKMKSKASLKQAANHIIYNI